MPDKTDDESTGKKPRHRSTRKSGSSTKPTKKTTSGRKTTQKARRVATPSSNSKQKRRRRTSKAKATSTTKTSASPKKSRRATTSRAKPTKAAPKKEARKTTSGPRAVEAANGAIQEKAKKGASGKAPKRETTEPVVEAPAEFQGNVMGSLNQRRGMIVGTQDEIQICVIEAEVPLSEMFGYSTVLRSLTQGKAQFTMEFLVYRQVPKGIVEELAKKTAKEKKNVA